VTAFAWNLVLAVLWAAVLGELSLANLAAGFVLGFAILALPSRLLGSSRYFVPNELEEFGDAEFDAPVELAALPQGVERRRRVRLA